ncbi:Structural maintenance of chromosomes protein 4 [Glycine max]|nr:Structural maintenance of chromosomes protein 4 [Glycine max]
MPLRGRIASKRIGIKTTMPELLSSAKSAVVKGQSQGRDETYVKQLSDYIIPNLVEALHKEPEVEICASMLDALNECINGERKGKKLSTCERGTEKGRNGEEREGGVQYYDSFLPFLLEACNDEYPDVRHVHCPILAVIYGVGVCAEFGGSVFNPLVGEALSRLDVVIRHPNALHADNIIAYDNVVSALGKICQFHRDSINAAQVVPAWLSCLPIKGDLIEAKVVHDQLCSMVERSDRELIGPNNQYLSKIVAVFAELDNDMRKCKEEFKEFERQDVKYREDFKHVNQKIKKLEDKVEKVEGTLIKEGEESTVLIPKLEDNIPKLQKLLLDEDKVLEEITESSKVETEKYRSELAKVRAELEPWEKDLIEHNGKLEVACTEAKLLNDKFNFLQIFAAKYDVAISTACHGLDYIVVETTNAAQACVELLRRENLGVATFMILEKQVDLLPKLKKNVSTPEGVPRFFDLVKVQDERIKLAFFAALRNTVVAKDLD